MIGFASLSTVGNVNTEPVETVSVNCESELHQKETNLSNLKDGYICAKTLCGSPAYATFIGKSGSCNCDAGMTSR
jgi:hypothetical protein